MCPAKRGLERIPGIIPAPLRGAVTGRYPGRLQITSSKGVIRRTAPMPRARAAPVLAVLAPTAVILAVASPRFPANAGRPGLGCSLPGLAWFPR